MVAKIKEATVKTLDLVAIVIVCAAALMIINDHVNVVNIFGHTMAVVH